MIKLASTRKSRASPDSIAKPAIPWRMLRSMGCDGLVILFSSCSAPTPEAVKDHDQEMTTGAAQTSPLKPGFLVSRPIGKAIIGQPWITDLIIVDLDQDELMDVVFCEGEPTPRQASAAASPTAPQTRISAAAESPLAMGITTLFTQTGIHLIIRFPAPGLGTGYSGWRITGRAISSITVWGISPALSARPSLMSMETVILTLWR